MKEFLERLMNPPREFTAIPFWFLNGDLDDDEIRRQLRDFCAHGVYGVVLHPRIGLPERIGYLSETFFHYIGVAIEEAARLGMQVVLYDEGMYPSGSACGQVVAENPDFASRGLALAAEPTPGDTPLAHVPGGWLVSRKSGGTIRGIHFGQDDGEENAPPSADILNPDAVDAFIRLTHEAYYRRFARYFGNTIIGFFTDEPGVLGRNSAKMFPWSLGFEADFAAGGGAIADLAALFEGEENASTKLYRQMILERECRFYYGKLSDWCAEHGIALMGHPNHSDDIELQKYFHIPGQDLVLRWIAPEKDALAGRDSTMGKCSADAAFWAGRRRNSNECFGACNRDANPWQLSGGDIKWYIDWLAVRGVNLFIPHAFYYSIEGARRDERPPDVGPNSLWWPYYDRFSGYMQRLSYLMTDIELHAPVAVPCENGNLVPDKVRMLYENQIGFRYMPTGEVADSRFEMVLDGSELPAVERDCLCNPPQPSLRVARFVKEGVECWLLVNEGETPIDCAVAFPTEKTLASYDLFGMKLLGAAGDRLTLTARESRLIFETDEAIPDAKETSVIPTPAFALIEHDEAAARKTYRAQLNLSPEDLACGSLCLRIAAEEMAEVFVNGTLADVLFWSPQPVDILPHAHPGENEIRIVVSGSLANRYGAKPVPYGLMEIKA